MSLLLLIGYALLLILGASILGWLARWYKYGGRCGPGGLADGIPNIDAERGTVALDGSEPVVAMDAAVDAKRAQANEKTRAALGTLKAGYEEARRSGSMPDAPGDDSTAARLAAVAGLAATKVEGGLSSASETAKAASEKAKAAAAKAGDATKSTFASVKGGFAEGKAPGETPDAPADGTIAAKAGGAVGGAAAAVGAGLSSAGDATKSTLASVKEGFAEGKAPGETPDEPADGSTAAKVGATVGGAAAAVGAGVSNATDATKSTLASVKEGFAEGKAPGETPDEPADGSTAAKVGATVGGAAAAVGAGMSNATDATKSTLASVKEGFVEGKAPGETPDEPADGSTAAKVGAAVGGATAAVGAGISKVAETVKDTASSAGDATKSTLASVKEGFAEGKAPGETPDEPADGSTAAKVGAVVGGAAAAIGAGVSSATDTAKDAASGVTGKTDDTARYGGRSTNGSSSADTGRTAPATGKGGSPDADASANTGAASVGTPSDTGKASVSADDSSDAGSGGSASAKGPGQAGISSAAGKNGSSGADGSADTGAASGMASDDRTSPMGSGRSGSAEASDASPSSTSDTSSSTGAASDTVSGNQTSAKDSGSADTSPSEAGTGGKSSKTDDGSVGGSSGSSSAKRSGAGTAAMVTGSAAAAAGAAAASGFSGSVGRASGSDDTTGAEDRSRDLSARAGSTVGQEDGHSAGTEGSGAVLPDLSAAEGEAKRLIAAGGPVSAPASALMSPEPGHDPDDLTRINGIGKATQRTLNENGIFYYDQIAGFGAGDMAWADQTLGMNGRVLDDYWVAQARTLSSAKAKRNGDTDTAALRARFSALSEEAADDTNRGSGMDAGMIDMPEELDAAEKEAERLIESGETVEKPANTLDAPEKGRDPDDLKLISGVGPKIESTLNENGVYYFDQIASFGGRDLAWADRTLGFKGRVVRDRWVPQAKALAARGGSDGGLRPMMRDTSASGNAPVNSPLKLSEAGALRLIENGFDASDANRPASLLSDGPQGGKADDLTRIKGIGDKLNEVLNGIGVYHFHQIAGFSAQDIAWVDAKLEFKGRIVRDRWLPQAEQIIRNGNS